LRRVYGGFIFLTFNGHKFELEDAASTDLLLPRIDEMKDTVV
jgi:hypothetical protein